ncbi:molybdopterin molybdotransferase MoeA [Pelagibaculum spongiae]|uniref:Molybdopterin molybdenumtransferase n=1 Tax=Pelagibaculum spongiae TaxID=2080658 RepID=A0A2V1H2H3_9GAMM|nr:gephyrin-like molybdotransferase Glp [Pelagibaculum spongiae]PVZ70652.1 molybdopterin molybdenumtransferase MoeA [Pelagibaculum spongiae]
MSEPRLDSTSKSANETAGGGDCDCSRFEKPGGLMPVAKALELLLCAAKPVTDTESIPLSQALDRVLAKTIHSPIAVPPADNSAMDGYALNTEDTGSAAATLPISQRIPAGHAPKQLKPGTAARIFTGAPVPLGANAVVMQEQCVATEGLVTLPADIRPGQNVRPAGQDIQPGALALEAGQRLRGQELGFLASLGVSQVEVFRKLKIAVISTGDELVEPGTALAAGKIYNSNRYTLMGLIQRLGMDYIDCGVVPDDRQATIEAFSAAAKTADVVITSGGVSVGEEDHVKAVVEQLGRLDMWKLCIKPGKPLSFGEINGTPFLGLPGNPAAVLVTFCVLGTSYLRKLSGENVKPPAARKMIADFEWLKAGKRQEYLRARIGEKGIESYPNQSSGMLSSACWADGLAVVPVDSTVAKGDMVEFYSFADLLG